MSLGLIRDIRNGVKILGKGELKKKLIIKAHSFSKSAKQAIIKAGGKAFETPFGKQKIKKHKKNT